MRQFFRVTGLNPTTGRMVELVLLAESSQVAAELAQTCGLEFVRAEPLPAAPRRQGPSSRGEAPYG